jgi:hypothetical protein
MIAATAMNNRPRKPTGQDGVVSLGVSEATYLARTLPERKEEIELLVARTFAAYRSPHRRIFAFDIVGEPVQNPTDDFDFTLTTSVGSKYLELMEVFLSDIGVTLPTEQFAYEPYPFAEWLYANIKKKSDRYRGATQQGIVLLTYSTHWQFALSNTAIWLLAHKLHHERLIFESVYHVGLADVQSPEVTLLFPTNVDFSNFDPERFRDNRDILIDPSGFKIERRCSAG